MHCRAFLYNFIVATSLSPSRGLAHSDVTDQSPLLIGRHTLSPVYHAAFLPYRDQSSFPILPIHTPWLETGAYPRPMCGLHHAPCTGPARGLTHRRPPAPSSCCTGPTSDASPTASCYLPSAQLYPARPCRLSEHPHRDRSTPQNQSNPY